MTEGLRRVERCGVVVEKRGKESRRRCLPHHPWCSLHDVEAEDSLEGTSFEPFYSLLSVHLWVYASCDTSGRLHLGQPGTFRGPWGSDSISPCFLPKNLQGGLRSELLLWWRQHFTPILPCIRAPALCRWGCHVGQHQCLGIAAPSSSPPAGVCFSSCSDAKHRGSSGQKPSDNRHCNAQPHISVIPPANGFLVSTLKHCWLKTPC